MNKIISATTGAALLLGSFGFPILPALADSNVSNFESYALGTVNGQNGWTSLGSAGSGCAVYDHAVAGSLSTSGFGTLSLRISNAVTSGCFGDQTFAKPLADSVGESGATAGSFSAGTRQSHFESEFDIASTKPNEEQPGLFVSVSPDRGDGSRMSYLGFSDTAGGLNVIFYDVQGTGNPANFVMTDLGTFSRSVPHHIKLSFDAIEGPSNDVVKVWIDGNLVHTGTSWENYYRYDSEASAEQSPRLVKTLIFRTGGTAVPANAGNGFLFDNVSLISNTPTIANSCPVNTTKNLVETVTVPSTSSTPTATVNSLQNGKQYVFEASGTWANRNNSSQQADAEYATLDSWTSVMDGYDQPDYHLGTSEFDLEVNNAFVDWGAYSSAHTYSRAYTGTGAPASFLIFDGDSNAGPTPNASWYGDNSGSLTVKVYSCDTATPPPTVPTSKDQCKKGGWMSLTDDLGHPFKNQGDCVSFVATHGKNKADDRDHGKGHDNDRNEHDRDRGHDD